MPSTYTARLKLERQASGENSGNWGNLVNYVMNRVDCSVKGYQAANVPVWIYHIRTTEIRTHVSLLALAGLVQRRRALRAA